MTEALVTVSQVSRAVGCSFGWKTSLSPFESSTSYSIEVVLYPSWGVLPQSFGILTYPCLSSDLLGIGPWQASCNDAIEIGASQHPLVGNRVAAMETLGLTWGSLANVGLSISSVEPYPYRLCVTGCEIFQAWPAHVASYLGIAVGKLGISVGIPCLTPFGVVSFHAFRITICNQGGPLLNPFGAIWCYS